MRPGNGPSKERDRISEICTVLRRAILDQALLPGVKLPEDTLGERFGVSRTIARHALGQLAAEGLVDLRRNRGAIVAVPSLEDARDLFDLRRGLEKIVVERLAGQLDWTQLAELRGKVDAEQAARGKGDPMAIRLATEFHIALAEMTKSPVLVRYVREVCLRCGLTLSLHGRPHSSECAISEHRAIIDALADGDREACLRLMDTHLTAVAERALVDAPRPRSADLMDVLAPYLRGLPDEAAP